MAFDQLTLKNPTTGEIKMAPVGFSWTTFFFGFWVSIFRADWKYAIIQFVLACFTWNLSSIVFGFIYNKLYVKDLLYKQGFKVTGSRSGNLQFASNHLGLELPLLPA